MAHGRVEHAALAVAEHHQHWFVATGALVLGIRIGSCQDVHIFGRATETVIQFILNMQPDVGQTASDGMLEIAHLDLILMLRTMVATSPRRGIANQFVVAVIDVRTPTSVTAEPSAQSAHSVVLWPIGECIACCVNANKPTTASQVAEEILFDLFVPVLAVVVAQHYVIVGKPGPIAAQVFALGGRGGNVHLKTARRAQHVLQQRRGDPPIVVRIVPIEN